MIIMQVYMMTPFLFFSFLYYYYYYYWLFVILIVVCHQITRKKINKTSPWHVAYVKLNYKNIYTLTISLHAVQVNNVKLQNPTELEQYEGSQILDQSL
jgi:hypothetical protein